jgi:hypothetical protein
MAGQELRLKADETAATATDRTGRRRFAARPAKRDSAVLSSWVGACPGERCALAFCSNVTFFGARLVRILPDFAGFCRKESWIFFVFWELTAVTAITAKVLVFEVN